MGLFDRFKKENKKEESININLKIDNLEVGDLLDYDLETWTVEKVYTNKTDGNVSKEWQLKSGSGKIIYLELEEDDEREISISKDLDYEEENIITFKELKEMNNDIIPEFLSYNGLDYEFSDGPFITVTNNEECICAEYEAYNNETESEEYLTIEQWDETDFSLSHTKYVEEYEFTNILKTQKEKN